MPSPGAEGGANDPDLTGDFAGFGHPGTQPLWLELGGHACFGWLTLPPSGRARALVALCPPLFGDRIAAHDTLAHLAAGLAAAGFAILRFDYPGTGDSPDVPREDLLGGALAAIGGLKAWAAGIGATRVAAVGMRMGATILALAQSRGERLDATVLWDPCRTGRSFLRQQRAMARLVASNLGSAQDPPEGVALPGFTISDATARTLGELNLASCADALGERSLVLGRDAAEVGELQATLPSGCEVEPVDGQPQLLDVESPDAVIPVAALGRIRDWMVDAFSDLEPSDVRRPATPERQPVGAGGVIERVVDLGPTHLFGILSEHPSSPPGPVVVFLNVAAEPHIGPGALWVGLSRELAAAGIRCARVDLSGLGDSPVRAGQRRRVIYSRAALIDINEIATALQASSPRDVVLVGLCSGAYAALEAGAALGARGVIAVGPRLDRVIPIPDAAVERDPAERLAGLDIAAPRPPFAQTVLNRPGLKRLVLRVPPSWWRIAHAVGVFRSPAHGLEMAASRVDDLLVLCSAEDGRAYTERGGWILDRLEATGRCHFDLVDVDHALLAARGRESVRRTILDTITTWCLPRPTDHGSD